MASFVIHNIAGEVFLRVLGENYGITLSKEDRNKFLMGNLIVDSSRIKKVYPENISEDEKKKLAKKYRDLVQVEKISTHFRKEDDLDKCIQTPAMDNFQEKYNYLFSKDISVLGYFFHLYTDKVFFDDLFTQSFRCLDKDGKETIYAKEVAVMQTLKDMKNYSVEEFWNGRNPNGIYTDYTKMNRILLEHYNIHFDGSKLLESKDNFVNPGIEEVDYNNIASVIKKTSMFIKESYEFDDIQLSVFDLNVVLNFIPYVVNNFTKNYSDLIELSCNKGKSRTKTL